MMNKSTKIIIQPPPPLPHRPSEETLNGLMGRNRSNSVPERSTSPNRNINSISVPPSLPPKPSPEAVRGMQQFGSFSTQNSVSRRRTNYNSIRPLPRDRSSSESSPVTPNMTPEIATMMEEYKKREHEMKEKIKLVLASVNEERLSLHKMVKHYKARAGQEETRSKGLEEQLKAKDELIQTLQSHVKDLELNRFEKVPSKPRAEEIELKNQFNAVQTQLKEEKEKNDDLAHRILFLEARLEKDLQSNKRLEEQFKAKMDTMDREIASRVRVELEKEFKEQKEKESQSRPSSVNSSVSNHDSLIHQLQTKIDSSHINNGKANNSKEPDYIRSVSSLSNQKSSQNEALHPPKESGKSTSPRSSIKPALPPKNKDGNSSFPDMKPLQNNKDQKVETKEVVQNSLSNSSESKPVEQSGVKKPKPSILALYDYAAAAPDDLDFQEGDLLILHKRYSDGWWLAELDGRMGRVPSNFMQDLSQVKPVRMIARGSFEPECQGDLKFKKGQIIHILNQEDDWWIGQLDDGTIGYLPRNYVKMEE